MLISWEYSRDDRNGSNASGRIASRIGVPRLGLTGFLFDGWDTNGPRSNTPLLPMGGNTVDWTQGPGHVDALFYDDRSTLVVRGGDYELDPFVMNRARSFHVDMEQGGVVAQFIGVAEPHGHLVSKSNYEETLTLAYYTCQHTGWNQLNGMTNQQTLHPLSRGWDVFSIAIQRGALAVPLRCPGASAWGANNAAVSNALTAIDPGLITGESLSATSLLTIAEFINRPNVFESNADSPLTPPTPPAIHFDGYCFTDQTSAVYAGGHGSVSPP